MKEFIINNSGLLLTLLFVLVGLVKAIISKNKQKVFADIYELVTDAQKLDSANEDKFAYVFDLAYNKLPKLLKLFFSKDEIKRAIEYSLNKLKAFSKAQRETTSTAAIINAAAINTNIQSGADIAANTQQNASPIN